MITSELSSNRARRVNEFLSLPRMDWTSTQPTTPFGTTGTVHVETFARDEPTGQCGAPCFHFVRIQLQPFWL